MVRTDGRTAVVLSSGRGPDMAETMEEGMGGREVEQGILLDDDSSHPINEDAKSEKE